MAEFVIPLYYNLDTFQFTDGLTGSSRNPLTIGQSDVISWAIRFVRSSVAVELTLPPNFVCGLKLVDSPGSSFLIQTTTGTKTGTGSTTVYTFTTTIASSQLDTQLNLAAAVNCAFVIYDSANGIATLPSLKVTILPNPNLTGSYATSGLGTLTIAAGKTVTFPLSLTFPSSAGTNGYKLTTDGATTLTWTADNAGTGDVVGPVSATDNAIVRFDGATGKLVQNSGATIGDDGSISANGAGVTAVSFIGYGAGGGSAGFFQANPTAYNSGSVYVSAGTGSGGGSIDTRGGSSGTSDGGAIYTTGGSGVISAGGTISTVGGTGAIAVGGNISTFGGTVSGGSITTSDGGGSIDTTGSGSIQLGVAANRITLVGTAGSNGKTATLPNVTGTVAVASASATDTHALFATTTSGAPAYRAIAAGDIAIAANTLSTGTAASITNTSGNTLTDGKLLDLSISSTAMTATGRAVAVALTGANSASSITTNAASISNARTGTTGANNALVLSASGATAGTYPATKNQALLVTDGTVRIKTTTASNPQYWPVLVTENAAGNDVFFVSTEGVCTAQYIYDVSGTLRLGAGSYVCSSSSNYGFTASNPDAALDTTISRKSAGIVRIGATASTSTGSLECTNLTLLGGIVYGEFTVGTFPTTTYFEAVVTDALAPVIGATVANGGSAKCKVMYNGSAKIVTAVL